MYVLYNMYDCVSYVCISCRFNHYESNTLEQYILRIPGLTLENDIAVLPRYTSSTNSSSTNDSNSQDIKRRRLLEVLAPELSKEDRSRPAFRTAAHIEALLPPPADLQTFALSRSQYISLFSTVTSTGSITN
jgi:hypothetical protein